MEPIYAVSLSILQGENGPSVQAHTSYRDDDRRVQLQLVWPELPKVNAGGDMGSWLYAVLGRLVEEFDSHDIKSAQVDGVAEMESGPRA